MKYSYLIKLWLRIYLWLLFVLNAKNSWHEFCTIKKTKSIIEALSRFKPNHESKEIKVNHAAFLYACSVYKQDISCDKLFNYIKYFGFEWMFFFIRK